MKNLRKISQSFFFFLILLFSINHNLSEIGKGFDFLTTESLHAICPFGGVVTLYQLITVGSFIEKIQLSAVILLFIVIILSILVGPAFCGWICPFGTYQDFLNNIGQKLFKKKFNNIIPKKMKDVLKYFRYFVLIWVIYITASSTLLLFKNVDPYYALFNFWTGEVGLLSIISLIFFTVLSLIEKRPWCKYFCPLGALLGISNKFRIFSIKRNPNTCIDCKKCDNNCPMDIEISSKEKIKDPRCISCLECSSENNCPIGNTVNLQVGDFNE